MREKQFIIPAYTTAQEVKDIRKSLGLTQKEFANLLGCSKPTIVRLETSEEHITGPIVLALYALDQTSLREQVILPEMKYRLRLTYMYKQKICTIMDVDEINEKVEIINYNTNIFFQAFGVNKVPTYQDFLEFLESRCFPRTRDKLKIELERLNLPFYDPMMIVEKTNGRMAEDDFWLKVERI